LARPHDHALEAVRCWLHDHGITPDQLSYSASKDNIKFSIPVAKAESLLQTKYHVYQHVDGHSVIRTPEWSIPTDLHQHIAAIQPTNSFLRVTPRKVTFMPVLSPGKQLMDAPKWSPGPKSLEGSKAVDDGKPADTLRVAGPADANSTSQINEAPVERPIEDVCNATMVTPACLRALYRTKDYIPTQLDRNHVAFTNYLNETSMATDLKVYLQRYRQDAAANGNVSFTIINNGANDQVLTSAQALHQQNAEGNLDGQTLVGVTYPMRVKAYNTGGSPPFTPDKFTPTNSNEPYLDWLDYMLANETDLPSTVSTSYGDNEQTVPRDYAILVCQKLAMLGSRGVTLLFASGDNGVGSDGDCVTNDGKDTPMFTPAFPDGCPYVTSVGGTKDFNPEVAAYDPRNKFSSGGGFSNYFPVPDYQKAVVAEYIEKMNGNYSTMFNHSGRAYPDISGQSQSFGKRTIYYILHGCEANSCHSHTME
jgi:tripeptidyl-peptidase-1